MVVGKCVFMLVYSSSGLAWSIPSIAWYWSLKHSARYVKMLKWNVLDYGIKAKAA
jgi:hypothetical protein